MFCPKCGKEMEDTALFCSGCGNSMKDVIEEMKKENGEIETPEIEEPEQKNVETKKEVEEDLSDKYDDVLEEEYDEEENAKATKKYIKIAIIALLLLFVGGMGVFVVYPRMAEKAQLEENQKEADKVINLIAGLEGKAITLEMEEELKLIQLSYEALTSKQKELVTNYDVLEEAFATMQVRMEEKVAQDLDAEIAAINISSLTADDTTVQELRAKFNALNDNQKKLITNLNKLNECEQAILAKAEEARKQQAIEDQIETTKGLLYNFSGFYGRWGDFGKHVNQYQGMIEAAMKREISLKNYFQGAPNDLYISVSSFQWDGQNVGTAGCYIAVEGPLKDSGYYGIMHGGIIVKNDGSLDFYIDYIY